MDVPGNQPPPLAPGEYFKKHLQFAEALIAAYNGNEPFHLYIKKYFSSNKKHGSKDRKQISAICYAYFRLGRGASTDLTVPDKALLGIFLCDSNTSSILKQLNPEWNERISYELNKKLEIVEDRFDTKNIFPFKEFLSKEIDYFKFAISFLRQPKLFVRLRPGKEDAVLKKIKSLNLPFEKINESCLVFSQNEKVTDVIAVDKKAVIQDYNSQRTGEFFSKYFSVTQQGDGTEKGGPVSIWDCCAGSGGKSILVVDTLNNVALTVTDVRPGILKNLKKRFVHAGIKYYRSYVSDIASKGRMPFYGNFQLIIADVPCSGSGTWSRTPEALLFFNEDEIERYAELQRNIIKNVMPHLDEGGILFYITCSVFKKENEDNVDFIQQNFQLQLLESTYLKGYEMQADSLFIAVFRKI